MSLPVPPACRWLCSAVESQAGLVGELLRNLEEREELCSEIAALQGQRGEAQQNCRKLIARLEVGGAGWRGRSMLVVLWFTTMTVPPIFQTLQHQQDTAVSEGPQAQRYNKSEATIYPVISARRRGRPGFEASLIPRLHVS